MAFNFKSWGADSGLLKRLQLALHELVKSGEIASDLEDSIDLVVLLESFFRLHLPCFLFHELPDLVAFREHVLVFD